MAEVTKYKTINKKKSSKVLDDNKALSNDELLEQILSQKKGTNNNSGKRRSSIKTNNSVKKSRSNSTKKVIKEDFSSDELYEQIKLKKGSKKKKENTSKKNYEVSINDNIVEITAETPIPMFVEEDVIEKEITNSSIKSENNSIDDEIGTLTTNDSKKKNDDLIITREIRFDDLSKNLKSKKNLNELREAIEEFDRLDDYDSINDKINEDIELLPSVMYSNYKIKKNLIIISIIIIIILVFFGVVFLFRNFTFGSMSEEEISKTSLIEEKIKQEELREKQLLYGDCLTREYSEEDENDDILLAKSELTKFLKDNYSVSVAYEDLTYGYSFYYDENKVYYAASTIKSLVALYVYTKASEGSINLDDTITYTSRYVYSYSDGVKKYQLGSKIPIRTLVKYSIIYSDNSAHQMLISYIGKSKIKEFGKSLGAINVFADGDNFGYISANDGLIYMKSIDEFVNNNGELGSELKSFFIDADQKELAVDNLLVANKYGLYKSYYHNMGIVYDESPYVVSIMTLEGYHDRENVINTISNRIYNLHNLYKSNRENICKIEVYGNEKSTSS